MNRLLCIPVLVVVLGTSYAAAELHKTMVNGKVTNSNGSPIDNALIILRLKSAGGAQSVTFATSDKSGEFSAELAQGSYDVFVSAPCFTPFAQSSLVPPSGKVTLNPVLHAGREICDIDVTVGMPTLPTTLPDRIQPK